MKVLQTLLVLYLTALVTPAYSLPPDSVGLKEQNGKTFIMHRVDKGETLFSIGPRYDVSVDQLKSTNPQTADELVVGEVILVPYDPQADDEATQSSRAWRYHTVEQGQTLFAISQQYNASVDQIRNWNNLKSNNIEVGQKLKVGKRPEGQNGASETGDTRKVPDSSSSEKNTGKASVSADTVSLQDNQGRQVGTIKTTRKGDGLVTKEQKGKATWLENSNINSQKSLALHRSAPAGTIIKVQNLMNDEVIFVRTVGQLNPQRHENTLIVLSKKAATELGVDNDYFRAKLQYTVKQPTN